MYTVSKGPSKIVAKTRRGLPQNYEKFGTIKDNVKKPLEPEKNNIPRPVFQTSKRLIPTKHVEEDVITPHHEEIVRYVSDSWNILVAQNPYDSRICKSAVMTTQTDSNNKNSAVAINESSISAPCYLVEPPSPVLSDFKPFDLESWWGRRLFYSITKSL